MFMSAIRNPDHTPSDSEHTVLNTNKGISVIRHAFILDVLNLSDTKATVTSAMDIVLVIAATVSSKKNNVDHRRVHGIILKTSGRVTNTSVVPSRLAS